MSPVAVPRPVDGPLAQEFERIYREYAPLVYRTAWGVLGTREDAEDVLQTIFLKLLRRESPPDLQKHPKAYLYKAAVTVSLDVLKAKRRRPVLVDDIDRLEIPAPVRRND
jgi:RNA polymerase sigma-70 factor (ECF subfamily)